MQKKIIALAVAAIASTGAFAQSNVTIYGNMDAGYRSLSGTHKNGASVYTVGSATATTYNGIDSGLNTSSLIGFRGQEDIGNGMKANFTAEYNLAVDGGAAAQAAGVTGMDAAGTALAGFRQAFVGLSGNFGSVSLGRMYTPFFLAAKTIDPFGSVGVASMLAIHPTGVASVARSSSSINYTSPNMSGFVLGAQYGMGERTISAAVNPSTSSLKAVYANGPLLVGAVYLRLSDATAFGQHIYSTAIGGTYAFAPMKLHVLYNSLRSSGMAADINNGDWLLGMSVPMGMGTIKAAINRGNDKTALNKDATHVGLGYQYNLSKRTNMYVQYGHVSNNQDGAYSMSSGTNQGLAVAATARTTGLSLGMGHSF